MTMNSTSKWRIDTRPRQIAGLLVLLAGTAIGCPASSPNVVQENDDYSYEDVKKKMAEEEAASLAEREE